MEGKGLARRQHHRDVAIGVVRCRLDHRGRFPFRLRGGCLGRRLGRSHLGGLRRFFNPICLVRLVHVQDRIVLLCDADGAAPATVSDTIDAAAAAACRRFVSGGFGDGHCNLDPLGGLTPRRVALGTHLLELILSRTQLLLEVMEGPMVSGLELAPLLSTPTRLRITQPSRQLRINHLGRSLLGLSDRLLNCHLPLRSSLLRHSRRRLGRSLLGLPDRLFNRHLPLLSSLLRHSRRRLGRSQFGLSDRVFNRHPLGGCVSFHPPPCCCCCSCCCCSCCCCCFSSCLCVGAGLRCSCTRCCHEHVGLILISISCFEVLAR